MIFCDTHTHLYAEEFDHDSDLMIHRAIDSGVKYMFLPAIDSSTTKSMLEVAARYPENCFPMAGLHPSSVNQDFDKEIQHIINNLKNGKNKFFAIGEVGIDLYWDKTFAEQQQQAFIIQIELAIEYDLPLIIHTRNSFDQSIEILQAYKNRVRGIFHCFGGSQAQANSAIEAGFLLGIGGVVTFKNSGLQKIVEDTDIRYLVLETDAPYLTPAPHRGKRNESSYIPYIAEKIAILKNLPVDIVAEMTTHSAMKLFKCKV